ncbi:MAG: hypothetical protein FWF24_01665 [Alphaproteobacteria bacterium]|nr:hypothetical protein [Alphaproteobacteria bacterium]
MSSGKNTTQENGTEQDAKKRILKLLYMLDASPGESAAALSRLLHRIEKEGGKFSDYVTFKKDPDSPSNQEDVTAESIKELEEVVKEFAAEVDGMKNDLRQQITKIDNLSREEGNLKKSKEEIEDRVYDCKCAFFSMKELPKPRHPRDGIASEDPPRKPKRRSNPEAFPSDLFAKPERAPDLGDKNPTWKNLVAKVNRGGPSAETALENLQKAIKEDGKRFIDVFEQQEDKEIVELKEKGIILKSKANALFRESNHLRDEIEDNSEIILQIKSSNHLLRETITSLKKQWLIYESEIKKHSQPAPESVVQPPPPPPPQQPGKGWPWAKIITFSCAFCLLAYVASNLGNKTKPRDKTPPQPPKTHSKVFYVAAESTTLWKNVDHGSTSIDMGDLYFGDRVHVRLPIGQNNIYTSDKWVYIEWRGGYVLGQDLSATGPVHPPVELPKKTAAPASPNENGKKQNRIVVTPRELQAIKAKAGAEPYKRTVMTAYVCAGKSLTGTVDGYVIPLDSTTPIGAHVAYYAETERQYGKIELRPYRDGDREKEALVFLSQGSKAAFHVPYESISLERSSCTQTKIIKDKHDGPK